MSAFALRRHSGSVLPPPVLPTLVQTPELSGIPQAGQVASVYGGDYSSTPTHYRFNVQRINPTTLAVVNTTTTTQTGAFFPFTLADADATYGCGCTVDVSFDGGGTYPITTTANVNVAYQTDVILPAVIPDPSMVWNSGTSKFDITGPEYPCLRMLMKVEDTNFAGTLYYGERAISEAERNTPFSIDLSGATDPAPVPAMPTINATDVFSIAYATPDYQWTSDGNNVAGTVSNWAEASQTVRTGKSRFRLTNTSSNVCFCPKAQVLLGGIDVLQSLIVVGAQTWTIYGRALRSSYAAPWEPTNQRNPMHFIGNGSSIAVLDPGSWVEFDFGVNVNGASMTAGSTSPYQPLTDFTIDEWDASGTHIATITRSGLTYTANETKTVAL